MFGCRIPGGCGIFNDGSEAPGAGKDLKEGEVLRDYGLYVITARDSRSGRGHLEVAEAVLAGGASVIQLRDKELPGRELLQLALRIRAVILEGGYGALLIINDRVDVAAAAGADGVHLGQEDLPVSAARKMLGPGAVVGLSVSSVEEARRALREPVDYLGVGPVFPTPSKDDAAPPMGLERLAEVRRDTSLPLVAIGGITESNAPEVLRAGADGIAVISAVSGAQDMREAARRLSRIVEERRGRSGPRGYPERERSC